MLMGGQLLGRLFGKPNHHVRSGLGYAAAIATAGALHQLGHIASARMVEAPMDTLLVTPIRTYTLYDDTGDTITRDQHRGRAIGGPVANITVGFAALVLSLFIKNRYLRFFGLFSTFIGFGSLMPAGGSDGEELFLRQARLAPTSQRTTGDAALRRPPLRGLPNSLTGRPARPRRPTRRHRGHSRGSRVAVVPARAARHPPARHCGRPSPS